MSSLSETQAAFAAALYDAQAPVPGEVVACGDPQRRTRGFAAYRNNVFVALVKLLEARFPAVARIVGEEFFRAAARVYVQDRPPQATLNLEYGSEFPAFLEGFPPAVPVLYLADIARLEWARHEASIAPEAGRLRAVSLAGLDGASLANIRFVVHPSLRVIPSRYAVVSIWELNVSSADNQKIAGDNRAEDALIVRPFAETRVHRLSEGGAVLVRSLVDGRSFGDACEAALSAKPELKVDQVLLTLIAAGGLSSIVKE